MQWAGAGDLWAGAAAPLRAARFIAGRPSLWPHCLLPLALNIIVFGALYWLTFSSLPAWLGRWIPKADGWLWAGLYYVLLVLAVVTALAVGVYVFASVGRVLAAPFLDSLTARAEALASGVTPPPGPGWLRAMGRAAAHEALKLLLYLAIMLALTLMNLILPLLGGAPSAVLAWLVTAFFLALEFMDYPLERRGLGLGRKIAAVWDTTPGWLGFGGTVFVLGLIPLVNLALLPLAAVGGTLYFIQNKTTPPS